MPLPTTTHLPLLPGLPAAPGPAVHLLALCGGAHAGEGAWASGGADAGEGAWDWVILHVYAFVWGHI